MRIGERLMSVLKKKLLQLRDLTVRFYLYLYFLKEIVGSRDTDLIQLVIFSTKNELGLEFDERDWKRYNQSPEKKEKIWEMSHPLF